MVSRVVALLALCLLAGCDTGPSGQEASIAAVRVRPGNPPSFNPPRVALVTVREDGSNLRVLVEAPTGGVRRIGSPAWSPDRQSVYFVGELREREGDRFVYFEADVFVVDARGGEPRRVTTTRDVVGAVVPSPDATTLLVARDEHPGERPFTTGLWLVDVNGGDERRLLPAEDGQLDQPGSWAPDGRTIAFTRCRDVPPGELGFIENTCAVHTVSPDGSGLRKLADRSSQPAFSPDGRSIAFVSDRDEHGEHAVGSDEVQFANDLYVMDADGGAQRRLTESESLDEGTPSWSPDGSRIAFAREGPARFVEQLMVVDADGTHQRVLVGDAAASGPAPSYSSPGWQPSRRR